MPAERAAIPILLYHGVSDGEPAGDPRFCVGTEAFRRQMDAVVTSGRRMLSVSTLASPRSRGEPMPADAAAVTFDDGTADFYARAWPVLRERRIPVTLYVVSGLVGRRHAGAPMLSWGQLEELRDAGVEIGAHGHRHVALDLLPPAAAAIELVNSRLVLEDRLQVPVRSFAFPFGYHTAAVKRLAVRAGYSSACGVKNALSHPYDDPFAIARIMLTRDATTAAVAQLLASRGAPLAWRGERVRTRLWRAYRRGRDIGHSVSSTW